MAMTGPIRYRMPDGAEIVSEQGSIVTMHVSMPADDEGHFGRECPSCKRMFRMHVEDYDALPDNQRLTCPYCCTQDDHSEFMTGQQQERALAAAGEYAQQLLEGKMDDIFGNMTRRVNARGGAVRMSYSGGSRTARPRPLPPITEEAPIRERTCAGCGNRYAVFGEHVACPVCGPLPPKVVAQDALEAQEAALAVFAHVPPEVLGQLREAGALERTAAGTLGSVVSILETFLKQTFLDRVSGGDNLIAGKGNIFQRLDDAAQLYKVHLSIDLPAALGAPSWDRLCLLYGVRHLLTHTNGIVDAKHLTRFPSHGYVLHQRVSVSPDEAREAVTLARKLVDAVP
jgi:hypothetical protein